MAGFHDAPLEPPGCEILAKSVIEDAYGGMAAIRFPLLDKDDNEIEFGTSCLGCQRTSDEYNQGDCPSESLPRLVRNTVTPSSICTR